MDSCTVKSTCTSLIMHGVVQIYDVILFINPVFLNSGSTKNITIYIISFGIGDHDLLQFEK